MASSVASADHHGSLLEYPPSTSQHQESESVTTGYGMGMAGGRSFGGTATSLTTNQGRPLGGDAQAVSTCLAFNQAYQEILDTFLTRVECSLELIKARESEVEQSISVSQSASGLPSTIRKQNKVPVLIYLPPYFKDKNGMCPPANEDTIGKQQSGEFDPLVEPNKHWTRDELKKLRELVHANALEKYLEQKTVRLEMIKEKLSPHNTNQTDKLLQEQLNTEQHRLRHDIAKARSTFKATKEFTSDLDWMAISNSHQNGFRSTRECELKWMNELAPEWNQNGKWTANELNRLTDIRQDYPDISWEEVTERLDTGRTPFQCFEKYQSELNQQMLTREWTEEDDLKLMQTVNHFKQAKYIPWEQVSYYMDGRTRSHCRTRYTRFLDPELKKGAWTENEDVLLLVGVQRFGARDWARVSSVVPGRTDQQCRERYTQALDLSSDLIKFSWSPAEDAQLKKSVKQHGRDWKSVADALPGRTIASVKARWRYVNDNALNRATRSMRELNGDVEDAPCYDSEDNEDIDGHLSDLDDDLHADTEPIGDEAVIRDHDKRRLKNPVRTEANEKKMTERRKRVLKQFAKLMHMEIDEQDDPDEPECSVSARSNSHSPNVPPTKASLAQEAKQLCQFETQKEIVKNLADRGFVEKLPSDVQKLVEKYKLEIERNARVPKHRKRYEKRRMKTHGEDRDIDHLVETTLQQSAVHEPVPDCVPSAERAELMCSLARALSAMDKHPNTLYNQDVISARSASTSTAYEKALMTRSYGVDEGERNLPLLPPCAGTVQACATLNAYLHKHCPQHSDTDHDKNKRRRKSREYEPPSDAVMDTVRDSIPFLQLQDRFGSIFGFPTILSSTPLSLSDSVQSISNSTTNTNTNLIATAQVQTTQHTHASTSHANGTTIADTVDTVDNGVL